MSSSYSESSETSVAGDYVGVESCIDLRNADDFEAYERECAAGYERRQIRKTEEESANRKQQLPEEFPPPMAQVPWVMKRYYTDDGRLIIREEKATHQHDYFRAHRSNGRLTLQLIPMDDDDHDVDDDVDGSVDLVDDDVVDELKIEGNGDAESGKIGDKLEEALVSASSITGGSSALVSSSAAAMVSSVSMAALCITEGSGRGVKNVGGGGGKGANSSGGGGAKKCYGFLSLKSSSASSLFDLQVPAISPIIS